MIRQRNPATPYAYEVRSLTRDDLQGLREKSSRPRLQRIRDSHHQVCRLFALGLSNSEVAAATGYAYNRITMLRTDPSIEELTARYRDMVNESFRERADLINENLTSVLAMNSRMMRDHYEDLDEAEQRPTLKEMLAVNVDLSDRFGQSRKSTNVNVNVDFAAKLEAARRRSESVIEGKALEVKSESRRLPPLP